GHFVLRQGPVLTEPSRQPENHSREQHLCQHGDCRVAAADERVAVAVLQDRGAVRFLSVGGTGGNGGDGGNGITRSNGATEKTEISAYITGFRSPPFLRFSV